MSYSDDTIVDVDGQDYTLKEYRKLIGESPSEERERSKHARDNSYVSRGYFYQDSYRPPEMDRATYLKLLHDESLSTNYKDFSELSDVDFKHLDRSLSIDFYFNDFRQVLQIFKDYYGEGTLIVTNGFRSPHELGISPHSTGIAMDIHAVDEVQSKRIMNAAFLAGIPTIIPNGEFHRGEGYVHLDIAPTADYAYDGGTYGGPWTK